MGGRQRTTLFMGIGEGKEEKGGKEAEKGKSEAGKEQSKSKKKK